MRAITLTGFKGSNQAIDPRQLNEVVGVRMENAYPGLGDLRPLRNHLAVATVPASPARRTIWRMGQGTINDADFWLSWSKVVNATLGFGTDSSEQTFYTGDGTPKWTDNGSGPALGLSGGPPYPQGTRELGVPAPTLAPVVALATDGATGTASTRFYVTTFVNDLGWESAPSPPSIGLSCKPGATVTVGSVPMEAPPSGSYGINRRRIYVTQTDTTNNANFYFLMELAVGTTTATDAAQVRGEVLPTTGWLMPPGDGKAIIALWNGMMAMLSGNGKVLHVNEAGYPYAYPLKYQKELVNVGVATAKWGQNLLVLTNGAPVVFQGQDPAGLMDMPPAKAYACLSPQSVVSFAHGIVWASNEGLAFYGNGGQAILTEGILTPEQWRALKPETMIAGRWQRFYVCSFDDGTGRQGFIFDPLDPAGGIVYLTDGFTACYYDPLADALYVLVNNEVRKFAAGATYQAASFTSKQFLQTHPTSFPVAKVVARGYPVTLEVLANGVSRVTRAVSDRNGFKLPDGFLAEDWQLKLSTPANAATSNSIQSARLAGQMSDLKGL